MARTQAWDAVSSCTVTGRSACFLSNEESGSFPVKNSETDKKLDFSFFD